jgi:hypothetical protein
MVHLSDRRERRRLVWLVLRSGGDAARLLQEARIADDPRLERPAPPTGETPRADAAA